MKKTALVITGLALTFAFIGCGNKSANIPDPVATVNGTAISSSDYINELNGIAGRRILQSMVQQQILINWADKEKVPVTDKQVEKEIDSLKAQGLYEEQVQQTSEDFVKNSARVAVAQANLAKKFIKVSDEEIKDAYEFFKSQGRYVHGPRKYVALIINEDESKLKKAQKDLKNGIDPDIVAAKYTDPRIPDRSAIKRWIDEDQEELPEPLKKAIKDTKVDGVSKIITLGEEGQTTKLVLKVLASQGKEDKSLKDAKDEVKGIVAMQKAQSDTKFQDKLNKQMKDAKIDIKIESFKNIEELIKNPAPAQQPMMQGQP